MIPKANFLQLPTILVGLLLLLLSFNFVAVAEETAAAADESEVRGPTFHGLINIDDNQENLQDYMTSSDGSGDELATDDEDQGSGNDEDVYPSSGTSVQPELSTVTAAPTVKEKLTSCLRQRKVHKESGSFYLPHCTKKGGYHKLQCTKRACWCVDPHGIAIKGTNTSTSEEKPDCEHGSNMSPCVKSLLKHSSSLLGTFRPSCSESGDYTSFQCHESRCWCVDKLGIEVENTRVNLPQRPTCVETTPSPTVRMTRPTTTTITRNSTPITTTTARTAATTASSSTTTSTTTIRSTTTAKSYEFLPKNPGNDINGVSVPSLDEVTNSEDPNLSGSEQTQGDNATPVTREPGIMAAIIAGAVVGLFVSILLAMFVVYRMRKKDEGSYPLDEPSKNNYTYTKAPDKEFYA